MNEPFTEHGNIFTFNAEFMWKWFGMRAILNYLKELKPQYSETTIDAIAMFAYCDMSSNIVKPRIGVPSTQQYLPSLVTLDDPAYFNEIFSCCMKISNVTLTVAIKRAVNVAFFTYSEMKKISQSERNKNDTK